MYGHYIVESSTSSSGHLHSTIDHPTNEEQDCWKIAKKVLREPTVCHAIRFPNEESGSGENILKFTCATSEAGSSALELSVDVDVDVAAAAT